VPHKLLLADDSVTIQRVIELTFADEDVEVIAVSDGEQAIAQLDRDPPDIVLADIGMPGKDGYEVAAYIRRSPRLSRIPVLLLAGAFEPVDEARMAAVDCDGVLAKPFEPQMVIGRVKELLARPPWKPGRIVEPSSVVPAEVPPIGQPANGVAAPAQKASALEDYFDRLGAAFDDLSGRRSIAPAESLPQAVSLPPEEPPAADPPLALEPEPVVSGQSDVPSAPPPPPPLPSLADAFTAILNAEERAGQPAVRPAWPSATPAIADDVVEEVVRRVLDRLPDRVVREAVSDAVTAAADRLVREEIDRIKASIK
jgi:CheY-like chemotaxis protein